MADRLSFPPYARGSSPAAFVPSEYWNPSPSLAYRAPSSPDEPEADVPTDWIHELVVHITDHPKFDSLFPSIKSCLQLDNTCWTALSTLREDPEARPILEFTFSVLYHVPPDDVWRRLAQLRKDPSFSDRQAQILAEVENAYCRKRPPNLDRNAQLAERPRPNRSLAFNPNVPTGVTDGSKNRTSALYGSSHRPPPSPVRSVPSTTTTPQRSRQAPHGWGYYCPSLGCKKIFKRRAHYCNHLTKHHPDFGPRHPYHSPQMSLRSTNGSSPSDSRHTVRFEDQLDNTDQYHILPSGSFPASQKRSRSSKNSIGVRSPGVDELMDDSVANHSGYSQLDAFMLHENSVLHMGGGALTQGIGPINEYYHGAENI